MKTKSLLLLLIILLVVYQPATSVTAVTINGSCPIWTVPQEKNGSRTCKCGSGLDNLVLCDKETLDVFIEAYRCMSFSEVLNKTVLGHCLYNMYYESSCTAHSCHPKHWHVPKLIHPNNTALCTFAERCYYQNKPCSGYKHQTGLMCTSCVDGYAYPVYSYSMACVKCKDYKYNWLKYIVVAFLPLTVFYIIVILFRITVTSGAMNGYILMCQLIAAPAVARYLDRTSGLPLVTTRLFFAFLAVWNLDFFRGLYHPFCLHPKLTTLQTLMLDYIIAVYPLLLVIMTYIFVKLHNRYSIVVWLWSPFYKCFALLRNSWDIKSSLVGAFATFILLSYVKILNVSFYALVPNTFYDVEGNQVPKRFLYYDGTYEYFGKDHIPYALLAIFMLLVFNIFPLVLLCLYPCRCFHRCLNYCRIQSLILQIFMDTINGCLKIQPRDYRYFAAIYFFLRILNHVFTALAVEPIIYLKYAGIMVTFMIALVAITRPYKSLLPTIADVVFLTTLSLSILCLGKSYVHYEQGLQYFLFGFVECLPIALLDLYVVGLSFYLLLPKRIMLKMKSLGVQCYKFIKRQRNNSEIDSENQWCYRFYHSEEYPPLLSTPVQND